MNLYRFVPAIVLLLPLSALAGPREDALDALSRCAALKDDAARLACYDSTAAQLQSALSAPPPPAPVAPVAKNAPPSPPTLEQKQRIFGFDGGITGGDAALTAEDRANGVTAEMLEADQIDSISSDMSEVAFNSAGRFTIYLANGQVWQQLSGDESFARYHKSNDKITITIERGFMGSFSLQFSDQTGIFKVRRTK
ncbi:MAG TPA: hypothetical protein VGU69_08955 [Rhizomicrobium sp.]|nr:hypothetical protein [Rhizomicrobium sp.]